MNAMNQHDPICIEESTGNVYEDLGYPDAAEMQRKAQLVAEIARAIKARRLTQQEATQLLEIDQAKILRITRGQFRGIGKSELLSLVVRLEDLNKFRPDPRVVRLQQSVHGRSRLLQLFQVQSRAMCRWFPPFPRSTCRFAERLTLPKVSAISKF